MRDGKKGQNFLYFCMLTPFSIEKRWLKWLGGGKLVPTSTDQYSVGRTLYIKWNLYNGHVGTSELVLNMEVSLLWRSNNTLKVLVWDQNKCHRGFLYMEVLIREVSLYLDAVLGLLT